MLLISPLASKWLESIHTYGLLQLISCMLHIIGMLIYPRYRLALLWLRHAIIPASYCSFFQILETNWIWKFEMNMVTFMVVSKMVVGIKVISL